MSQRTASRLLVAPDSRSAERALLAELERATDEAPLGRRLVIVPSLRLRVHLLSRLARARPAWLGLEITTLRGFARTIVERAGESTASGAPLLPVLAARLAATEPAFARPLGTLKDGYAGVAGVVRDLLDAGLVLEHLEPALERVAEEESAFGRAAVERAGALLRISVGVREELLRRGLAPDADLFSRAGALVASEPAESEGARNGLRLFIHGIADATGAASDLLAAATRAFVTVVVSEEPAGPSGERLSFGRRLLERFAGIASVERIAADPAARPRIRLIRAQGPADEAALAIGRLGECARAGGRPERCAVVARQLAPYSEALAREIDRRAVPASGEDGPAGPAARLAAAWIELLSDGGEADLGLLLAAAGDALAVQSGARIWEIRHGAAGSDVHDLATFAALAARPAANRPTADARLPVRDAMTTAADDGRLLAVERRMPSRKLLAAAAGARRLLAGLQSLSARTTLAVATSTLSRLLHEFVTDAAQRKTLLDALSALQSAPAAVQSSEFSGEEVAQLFGEAWSGFAVAPFGAREGGGEAGDADSRGDGGLALLSVTEARGLTFDTLALLGLAQDRFPRAIRSDPFLPDPMRLRLRDLLPDLPVKSEGHEEERFLFAQLLGAAQEIEIYVPRRDGDGKELAESSFLAPLARAGRIEQTLELHPGRDLPAAAALELAERSALAGTAVGLESSFALALGEARSRFDGEAPASAGEPALASARLAVLREFDVDPSSSSAGRLGPYFGFIGPRANGTGETRDPRSPAPAVTTLEALGTCGWQAFLEKLLRMAPTPATGVELPTIPASLFGLATHAALQWMAPQELAERTTLAQALAGPDVLVPWPEPAVLSELIARATRRALEDEGLEPELFAPAVELAVRQNLEVAREHDWPAGGRPILGIEVNAEAEVETTGGPRTVRFRADRVERGGDRIVFTDYKTGAPLSSAKRTDTRSRHLAKALEAGKQLQLAAYTQARELAGRASGRLLYLRPDLAADRQELRLEGPFSGTPWGVLLTAWDAGAFLPRLLQKDLRTTGKACKHCAVRVACLQGDSGARLRLARWVEQRREGTPATGDLGAAAGLFDLESGGERDESEESAG